VSCVKGSYCVASWRCIEILKGRLLLPPPGSECHAVTLACTEIYNHAPVRYSRMGSVSVSE
jgi:hypothetical protein